LIEIINIETTFSEFLKMVKTKTFAKEVIKMNNYTML
jgi:hypothetical protein